MKTNEQIFREINAELAARGIKKSRIAEKLGISRQQVWQVARGIMKTRYIREEIILAIGRDPWAVGNNPPFTDIN